MKITKTQLKQIIKEELEKVAEQKKSTPGDYYDLKALSVRELGPLVVAKRKELRQVRQDHAYGSPEHKKVKKELEELEYYYDMATMTGD